jgi:phosphatidylglycerophosphatase A
MRNLVLFLATGAGSGYAPVASGTFGSGVGLILYALLARMPLPGYFVAVVATTAVGTWAADRAEAFFGRKDDGRITIDEIAGMLLSLMALPVRLDVVLVGFLLFRLFDIVKVPPARACERLRGGIGVMADDLVAGIYANLVGQVIWRFLFPGGLA